MGVINKAFKVRIYPNLEQQTQINKTLGSCRALYNMMLFEHKQVYEKLKDSKRELYDYKYKTEKEYKQEFEWMKEADSQALQQARIDMIGAYSKFFKGLSKKYKQSYGFPKFKKKKNESSYRTTMTSPKTIEVDFNKNKIKLPKIGWVKFRDRRTSFKGKIKSATVRRTATGKYFVSVLFEQELELEGFMLDSINESQVIGLDASLENFFVDQNGNSPAYERLYRKFEPRLKKLQRQVSKKKKGSNNQKKAQMRVNKIHEKIANKRKDFTHKLSKDLTRKYQVIVAEHLSLKGMSQALKLGKSVMDLGYSEFIRQLQYKSLWNNKLFIQADKWFASSKTCSICGFINKNLQLSDRSWICPNCGENHDRDTNAGQNLQKYGMIEVGLVEPDFKPVEILMHKVESKKQEILEVVS